MDKGQYKLIRMYKKDAIMGALIFGTVLVFKSLSLATLYLLLWIPICSIVNTFYYYKTKKYKQDQEVMRVY